MTAKHLSFRVVEIWDQILVLLLIVHDLEQVPSLFSQKLSDAHFSPLVKGK